MKCPRCHIGDFFEGHPYQFSTLGEVKQSCKNCGLKYSREPGFFQGSYYVSYALGVALLVTLFILKLIFLPSLAYLTTLLSMVIILVFLAPLLFALSKIIWINIFVNYDSRFKK
ncbi:DUF983 domain-containing protein [uncultured Polaribacter sp.]|uniref:DUF983 domain-containing protein n=1 Tax=uncultured Polaribacter sp. TaxID=174711 RepID=UPI002622C4A1|nr:DUF983 domain-containing protein [uncultured Polaribacter sp.]